MKSKSSPIVSFVKKEWCDGTSLHPAQDYRMEARRKHELSTFDAVYKLSGLCLCQFCSMRSIFAFITSSQSSSSYFGSSYLEWSLGRCDDHTTIKWSDWLNFFLAAIEWLNWSSNEVLYPSGRVMWCKSRMLILLFQYRYITGCLEKWFIQFLDRIELLLLRHYRRNISTKNFPLHMIRPLDG